MVLINPGKFFTIMFNIFCFHLFPSLPPSF